MRYDAEYVRGLEAERDAFKAEVERLRQDVDHLLDVLDAQERTLLAEVARLREALEAGRREIARLRGLLSAFTQTDAEFRRDLNV